MDEDGKQGNAAVTTSKGVWVAPGEIELSMLRIAGLPVVDAVLAGIGFDELLASYLPEPDSRCQIPPAQAIGVLVRNLALGRQPLYGLGEWASSFEPQLLGLDGPAPETLSDDCVGRALDELFLADRASRLTALSLSAISAYQIALDELHHDSTSLTLYGAYREANGEPRGGAIPARPARGFNKDHRPELKQLVWVLTISADGAVPVTYRMLDGNTEDSTPHVATWERCRALAGRSDFLYVADCKLATRDNMEHIASHGRRFLTILPRSRSEEASGRAWLAKGPVPWKEISRQPGKRKADPPEIYWRCPRRAARRRDIASCGCALPPSGPTTPRHAPSRSSGRARRSRRCLRAFPPPAAACVTASRWRTPPER